MLHLISLSLDSFQLSSNEESHYDSFQSGPQKVKDYMAPKSHTALLPLKRGRMQGKKTMRLSTQSVLCVFIEV